MPITIAATQMACSWDIQSNIEKAINLVHKSADLGAQIILLQELFETPYFCINTKNEHFDLAKTLSDQPTIKKMQAIAKEREVVLPISFFEKSGLVYFNSIVVIDADGSIIGHYRKSHIPDFPLYEEKFYFTPGDTGFRVFDTKFAKIGPFFIQQWICLIWL